MQKLKWASLLLVCAWLMGFGVHIQRAQAQDLDCNYFEDEIRAKLDEALTEDGRWGWKLPPCEAGRTGGGVG